VEIIELPIKLDDKMLDSRYRMVVIGAQRARQLMEGARASEHTKYAKATTVALEEFLAGELRFVTGKEARLAQRDARKKREELMRRRSLLEREEEISAEIKKDLSVYIDDSAKRAAGSPESPA
jgi:DNA-directed RNA polymerase subunit omega